MPRIDAQSDLATSAHKLVRQLQARLVAGLETIEHNSDSASFEPVDWLRQGGEFGGGQRYVAKSGGAFNRASVNVSQVHYESDPSKPLGSATAISTIVHPQNPAAPSMHMHISWTELKAGRGYWRIMADLNPSLPRESDRARFAETLREAAPDQYESASAQGERYFYIPALCRHRGVSHFYLEEYTSGDFAADYQLAKQIGERVIDCYLAIVSDALSAFPTPSEDDKKRQLDYHTLYFFQVLTLDRGTTSGLLVHADNDVGILGSLPAKIDRDLLHTWLPTLSGPPQLLLQRLLAVLPNAGSCEIDESTKAKLAVTIREFYQEFPQATQYLAQGDVLAPTTQNHR